MRAYAMMFFGLAALAMLALSGSARAQDALQGDTATGKMLYNGAGCYECHGYVGQGSTDGPELVTLAPFAAFLGQLRQPVQIMPPYEASVLSDAQVADIYAYIETFPKPPDPKSIGLLK